MVKWIYPLTCYGGIVTVCHRGASRCVYFLFFSVRVGPNPGDLRKSVILQVVKVVCFGIDPQVFILRELGFRCLFVAYGWKS